MSEKEDTTRYVPDWETECQNCGQAPTVTVEENGVVTHRLDLCGPCTWGDADTLDTETWNN
jgi:hypothetical protein